MSYGESVVGNELWGEFSGEKLWGECSGERVMGRV